MVIVGHQAEEVERAVLAEVGELASFVVQAKQRGTGDAVEVSAQRAREIRFARAGAVRRRADDQARDAEEVHRAP